MTDEMEDTFWDVFFFTTTEAAADALHTKVTEKAFVHDFESHTPKLYEVKPQEEPQSSFFLFGWSSAKPELAPLVFYGLQSVGIMVKQGWYLPDYIVYENNITKDNIHKMVSDLPEEAKTHYTINEDRLYDYLKSKYPPKKESPKKGGKKKRTIKRKYRKSAKFPYPR